MTSFEKYIKGIKQTQAHNLATPENSYLEHLKPLLESALEGLGLSVVVHPKNQDGSGLADLGLFETGSKDLVAVVEAEAPSTDISDSNSTNAKSKEAWRQAKTYSKGKGATLLTNFHEFILVEKELEVRRVSLGGWQTVLTTNTTKLAKNNEQALKDLLRDWASRRAEITNPEFLAERLADYAREALKRLENIPYSNLNPLRKAMEEALGIQFEAEKGEHFFRSSLVQALFYGLFSAWVVAAEQGASNTFDLSQASLNLRVPLVTALFDEVAHPKRLKNFDLRSPVLWALEALRRVVPAKFIGSFQAGKAVQYFYEPFLAKFDPQLRKELGIWYTPHEIVRYQIERTHELLQTELGIAKGLLDDNVTLLDPAVGTGSYLVEVARFMLEKLGNDPLKGLKLKKALTTRVYGFEILPAPFVIAHLQLGLLLDENNASLGEDERVGVYLTNSLLNWTPNSDIADNPIFPEFAKEQQAAENVKQQQKILVFIGNPPYSRFSGTTENEEAILLEPYKRCLLQSWGIRKQTLDDLYIRFIRLAEWRIVEHGGRGLISFITNRSFLTGISHPVMRQHLLQAFHSVYLDDLHGSQRANLKGDGSVFTTETAPGIRVGVTITHLVRKATTPVGIADVFYREFFGSGESKRQVLLEQTKPYSPAFKPKREHRFLLKPLEGEDKYWTWTAIPELFPVSFSGVNSNRDDAVIAFDEVTLKNRFKNYYDANISNEEVALENVTLMTDAARYNALETRKRLLRESQYRPDRVVQFAYRPFDMRWLYWEEHGKLLNEKRKEFFAQVFEGNVFLSSTQQAERLTGFDRIGWSTQLSELHFLRPDADAFPWQLRYQLDTLFSTTNDWQFLPNSPDFYTELVNTKLLRLPRTVDGCEPKPRPEPILERYCVPKDANGKPTPEAFTRTQQLLHHALAIMNTPAYRLDFSEYLAEDWARIPLPLNVTLLESSAALGARVAVLLNSCSIIENLPTNVAMLHKTDGTALLEADFMLEPTHSYAHDVLKLSVLVEVHNVSQAVWGFTLGGYAVIKKWLDYREGRLLSLNEIMWLLEMIRRIHTLLEMTDELNANYDLVVT
jgi:hypothetical protein